MRRDKTKSRLSIIATVVSVVLVLIYWLAPADEKSHPLYTLFVDCIPDSLVVLITIPIVYWLLYTRGLTNMGDCPLFTGHTSAEHGSSQSHDLSLPMNSTHRPIIKEAAVDDHSHAGREILFIAILQDKSIEHLNTDTMMATLNTTLRLAETRNMSIVFIKFFLSFKHPSTEQGAASQSDIATAKIHGTEWPYGLYKPAGSAVFSFFLHPQTLESSLPENAALNMLFSAPRVREVYVAGITPGYCFEQICRIALQHKKRTVALKNSIALLEDNIEKNQKIWQDLTMEGLVRQEGLS